MRPETTWTTRADDEYEHRIYGGHLYGVVGDDELYRDEITVMIRTGTQPNGAHAVDRTRLSISEPEDLLEAVPPEVPDEAVEEHIDRIRERDEAKRNQSSREEILAEAEADLEDMLTEIPEEAVRVRVLTSNDHANVVGVEYEVDGERVDLDAEDVTIIGWASAQHVNAGSSFWREAAAYTTREALKRVREEAEAEKQKAERAEQARRAERRAAFAEASDTGERVRLEKTTVRCDGSARECDLDLVTRYALPDGTTETERSHTH
jgi:hypothetical protein